MTVVATDPAVVTATLAALGVDMATGIETVTETETAATPTATVIGGPTMTT